MLANGLGSKNDCALVAANDTLYTTVSNLRVAYSSPSAVSCSSPRCVISPVGAHKCPRAPRLSAPAPVRAIRSAGGGTRKFNSGRKTISTSVTSCSVRSPFCPGKQAAPFFSGAIRKKAQSVSSCVTRLVPRLVLCQLQFSRCWRGHLTLILSVTMFSNYHSLHTNMIAWLAVLFPWQLLWFWLCQSLRSLLRVASNSGSPSRSLFLFFYFPSCVGWLFEVYSLFFTVEKLFKNSCPAPLQCYYLWAQ